MKFKNALALLTLVLPQILTGSAEFSGFGSPVPSRSTSPAAFVRTFGVQSPLATPLSPKKANTVGAAGAAAHTSASAAAHDLATDEASVSLTLPKPQGVAQNAAAALSTDSAPAQQKDRDALSTDDAFSTDDFDDLSARTTDFVALSEQHVVISTVVSSSKVVSQAQSAAAAPQTVLASALASQQKTLSLASGSAGAAQATVHALDSAPQKPGASSAALSAKKPNMVTRKVKFGRPQFGDSSMCQFEFSATYDAGEEPTLTTRANKIPASLWKAMHEAIKIGKLQCVQRDPSASQDASYPCFCTYRKPCHITADENMRPEVLEVFVYDAAPAPANSAAAPQTAAVGAPVVAASEQQKDFKEQAALAPKWVKKMVRFQRKGQPHTYEVPVEFNENDPQTRTTSTQAKIAASLWAGIQHTLSNGYRAQCLADLCTHRCQGSQFEAEECEVSTVNFAPKIAPIKVSISESEGDGECYRTVYRHTYDYPYDLNDTELVKIGGVTSSSFRFSSRFITQNLFRALKHHHPYLEARSLFLYIEDLKPNRKDLQIASIPEPIAHVHGIRWTRVCFSSPTQSTPCQAGEKGCCFIEDPYTGWQKESAEAQNKAGRDVALNSILRGTTECRNTKSTKPYPKCTNKASILSHCESNLAVQVYFPKDWGSG
jgi:hypothetical protein